MGTRVSSLHRYAVKSMLGEDLASLDVDERAVVGDRGWSVSTAAGKLGSGKWSNRFAAVPGLLDLRAGLSDAGVVVTLPDGQRYDVTDPRAAEQVSRHVGEPVTFVPETQVSHFDDGPVSLIGLASVRALADSRGQPVDPARFRANIRLDTATAFVEDEWIGRRGNLAALGPLHDQCLGVIACVVTPGQVRVGDELAVL